MNENLTPTTDRYPNQSATPQSGPKYKGVGGWLLFFCLSLTVFSPLLTIVTLIASYSEGAQLFDSFPSMRAGTVIDALLSLGLMAFSVYAGVGLWRVKRGAVRTAKRYLLCGLAYGLVSTAAVLILVFMAGFPSDATEAFRNAFRPVAYFALWSAYLNRSERVKVTFAS